MKLLVLAMAVALSGSQAFDPLPSREATPPISLWPSNPSREGMHRGAGSAAEREPKLFYVIGVRGGLQIQFTIDQTSFV